MSIRIFSLALLALTLASSGAAADDWKIVSLTGDALVFHAGQWVRLRQGDIVADDAVVRTMANGSLRFMRDRETIDLQPNTQIQIFDRTGERFTTVREFFGTVGIEANVENVKHFSVRTPYLAAVVKGTIFGVSTTTNASAVAVQRGLVGVNDTANISHADVHPGQAAVSQLGHGVSVGAAHGGSASAAAAAAASAASASSAANAAPAAPASPSAPSAPSSPSAPSAPAAAPAASPSAAASTGHHGSSSGGGKTTTGKPSNSGHHGGGK